MNKSTNEVMAQQDEREAYSKPAMAQEPCPPESLRQAARNAVSAMALV